MYTPQYEEEGQQPTKDGPPEDPSEEIMAYTYVFPDGTAEHTVVRIADEDDPDDGWTIEVMPISGEIKMTEAILDPQGAWTGSQKRGRRFDDSSTCRLHPSLEVIIALGILAGALVVLVDNQAMAVLATQEADRLTLATNLAQEKMMEVQLILEREGFGEQDIEEDGDFEEFGAEEFRGDELHLGQTDEVYEDFKWAYTVRKIEMEIPNLGDMAGDLAGNGYFGEDKASEADMSGTPDLGDMGIDPSAITDHLSGFIREVRVRVWWGKNEDENDQVELTTHIITPTG